MTGRSLVIAALIAVFVSSPIARAQQKHVATPETLKTAIAAKLTADDENRQAVRKLLAQPQVREVADRFGLSIQRAETALASLSSAELAELAKSARTVETELAGGDQVIVISITTLLLIIIIVLLVAD
jgi:hypothetical protein